MRHGRITTSTPQKDGTLLIRTEGYYEELNSIKEEVRQNINTTQETLLKDIIRALDVFNTTDTAEITLRIIKRRGVPQQIVKTYTVFKKKI